MRSGYISHMRCCSINMHVQLPSGARGLDFLQKPSSTSTFVGVSNEGSSQSELMYRRD